MNDAGHMVYLVATLKRWNVDEFARRVPDLPGAVAPRDRTPPLSMPTWFARSEPRYIFFPHWSWKVPDDLVAAAECVCFHMTDVPFGRGGSPLQNLVVRGHAETKISALRMVSELDAGPVYMKRSVSLEGAAHEIFERCARTIFDMMEEIVVEQPEPVPQSGSPVVFPRRQPEESRLPQSGSPRAIYDHIRMLDAEGYPSAFLDYGDLRLRISRRPARGRRNRGPCHDRHGRQGLVGDGFGPRRRSASR